MSFRGTKLSKLLTSGRAVWTLAVLLVLGGCASGPQAPRTRIVPYTLEQLTARDEAREARYRIRTGDVLRLSFKYEKDLNEDRILVLPDGYINLPGVGSVRAAGSTIPDLDKQLNALYGREYRNPDLSLLVVEIGRPEIYVLGSVKQPGLYKMPEQGMGVLQAVATAGGFLEEAQKSQTVILRAGPDGFIIRSYDLAHIEEDGIMDLSYFDLQPFDIVYVPQSKLADLVYLTSSIFGSFLDVSNFFWDIYAVANVDKIDRLVR